MRLPNRDSINKFLSLANNVSLSRLVLIVLFLTSMGSNPAYSTPPSAAAFSNENVRNNVVPSEVSAGEAVILETETMFWEEKHWEVTAREDLCQLYGAFDDGNEIIITYNAGNDDLLLSFTNDDATSVKDGEERKINMYFGIQSGKNGAWQVTSDWENLTAKAKISENRITRLFSLYLETKSFLSAFARNSGVTFHTTEGQRIGAYFLNGSREAVAKLRECSFKQAGLNIADPFLK